MARVDAFQIDGLNLWFWSSDHRPPHFHAKRAGEWEIRVFIETTTAKELAYDHYFEKVAGPNGRMRRKIAGLVAANRDVLLQEWEDKVLED